MSIKTKTVNGKTRYQALIYFDNAFYGSKTFDLRPLAEQWHDLEYAKAVNGEILPVSEQKAADALRQAASEEQRTIDEALDLPLLAYAQRYIADQPNWDKDPHGPSRNNDYLRVAALAGNRPVRDFDGREGAQVIRELTKTLYASRGVRIRKDSFGNIVVVRPSTPRRPLEQNTVRLLLTALFRLLDWITGELPEGAVFTGPEKKALKTKGWVLPPAHRNKRKRAPSDQEFALVLHTIKKDSDLGEMLQVQDETGCRQGEVRDALGSQLTFFFDENGELFGGNLNLPEHKTKHKTGEDRDVPLSLVAARLLYARKQRFGNGRLFPNLGTADSVCKAFDAACIAAGVSDLLTKDFRRSFANRNKTCVPYVDLIQVMGDTKLLDPESASPAEKATQKALGHTDLHTTVGYSVPEQQGLARTFTRTSRNASVLALVATMAAHARVAGSNITPHDSAPVRTFIECEPPSQEVLALARALGTYDDCFNTR